MNDFQITAHKPHPLFARKPINQSGTTRF